MAFIISQIVMLSTLIMMLHGIFNIILKSEQHGSQGPKIKYMAEVRRLFIPMIVILTAFFIRGLYRMADSIIGYNHTLIQTEALFVNLDGCMSLVVILGFNFFHPGQLLERRPVMDMDLSSMEKQQWQPEE